MVSSEYRTEYIFKYIFTKYVHYNLNSKTRHEMVQRIKVTCSKLTKNNINVIVSNLYGQQEIIMITILVNNIH